MYKKLTYLACFCLMIGLVSADIANAQHDPSLKGWWKFDEISGTIAFDSSGNGNDGILHGGPQWVAGQMDGALQFDGEDDYVDLPIGPVIGSLTDISCSVWVNFTGQLGGFWQRILDFGSGPEVNMFLTPRGQLASGETPIILGVARDTWQDEDRATSQETLPDGLSEGWHHVAVTVDMENRLSFIYVDGQVVGQNDAIRYGPQTLGVTTQNWLGRSQYEGDAFFTGALDEVRLYDFAMTPKDVQIVMDGGILIFDTASRPRPSDGAEEVARTAPLSWKKGLFSVQRNVYLGTDFDDVNEASVSDPRGVLFAENLETTTLDPGLLDYGKTYFWRVDEMNAPPDSTTFKGEIWSFTVLNFALVDNFETYDANNIIYDTWSDYFVNNTGMTVGYFDPPYIEQSILHGGDQSMPVRYDNDGTVNEGTALETAGTQLFSEAELQWPKAQDWTRDQIESLSIWFRGYRPYMGEFLEDPAGIYSIKGAGEDIWGFVDQCHFAYKEITGATTIIAKIESLENTDPFAKAGVMIRDTLDANSRNMAVLLTTENGVRFQYRFTTGETTERQFTEGLTAPYWLRIERTAGSLVRAYYSADGSDWTSFSLRQLSATAPLYVGLAVTSHNPDVAAEAVFSNVTITGTGSEQPWKHQDLGLISNSPEPLYVNLNDTGFVYYTNSDPNAPPSPTLNPAWQQWQITLKDFADQGVDLTKISKFAIGVGTHDNTTTPGGSGTLYIDDIRLYRPPEQ